MKEMIAVLAVVGLIVIFLTTSELEFVRKRFLANKDYRAQERGVNFCPNGLEDETQDLLCKTPIDFEEQYKNPCWHNRGGRLSCLPYFMLIGMSKCATTDLFCSISRHQEILPPEQKELRFEIEGGFDEYVRWFDDAAKRISNGQKNLITGEATPLYLWKLHDWIKIPQNKNKTSPIVLFPDIIQHFLPKLKILIILRDPVARAHSHFFFDKVVKYYFPSRRKDKERINARYTRKLFSPQNSTVAFDMYVANELKHITKHLENITANEYVLNSELMVKHMEGEHYIASHVAKGMYYYFVKEWFKRFPKEQFLLIRFSDYIHNKVEVMNRIFHFLNISSMTRNEMIKAGIVTKEISNFGSKAAHSEISDSTKQALYDFYKPYNEMLFTFLEQNNINWNRSF